jgi:hypothetical protein
MDYEETVRAQADPARTWQAMAAVTTYPRWTASMTEVTGLDGPDLALGHRFRIHQPGLPPVVWRVSELRAGEAFSWESHAPGLHAVAFHRLRTNADGSTQITIGLHQTGPLAGLIRLVTQTKTRRYLTLEAAGLKAAAES